MQCSRRCTVEWDVIRCCRLPRIQRATFAVIACDGLRSIYSVLRARYIILFIRLWWSFVQEESKLVNLFEAFNRAFEFSSMPLKHVRCFGRWLVLHSRFLFGLMIFGF